MTLTAELQTRLLLEARQLALLSADALLSEYPELTLCPLVTRMQDSREDLALVAVVDHEGLVHGHSDVRLLGAPLTILQSLSPFVSKQQLEKGEALLANPDILAASVPVAGQGQQTLGRAVVGLKRSHLERLITHARHQQLLVTAAMLLASVTLALIIMQRLLRPVGELKLGLERIGRGQLDTPLRIRGHTELSQLAETVNIMASRLRTSQKELLEKERLTHEMDLARSIQESLMPINTTEVGDFLFVGHYHAATEVGGDYYDVCPLANDRMGIVMADVGGKGLGGCMVTSMLAVLLRALRHPFRSPSDMLMAIERNLCDSLRPGVFVTMFYGILDCKTNQLTFASAAHSPLLIYRAASRQVEWRRTRGIPIGAVSHKDALRSSLGDESIVIEPGDILLQFTDGLNEACGGHENAEFGFAQVESVVSRAAEQGAQAVLHNLKTAMMEWTGHRALNDDLTLLVIERRASRAGTNEEGRPQDQLAGLSRVASREELERLLLGTPHLAMPACMSELTKLHSWLLSCPVLCDQTDTTRRMAETCLYEVCANIIEHGVQGRPGAQIDLWWLPFRVKASATLAAANTHDELGQFLVLDEGMTFDLAGWRPADLHDPRVRRQGRGFGLQIVHSAMRHVEYTPIERVGNATVMTFAPRRSDAKEETLNV